jgi:hypothetical protein
MPLPEITQIRRQVSSTIRIDESTASQIDQYAAFLPTTADQVVNKALACVFAEDRDFQEFLQTPEAAHVPPSFHLRRPDQNGSASERANGNATPAKLVEIARDARSRS